MFENLSGRLSQAAQSLRGRGRLTEDNIRDTLRQIRMALLEADVALPVVKSFIEDVRTRALGDEVARSLTPGQALVKIVHDELVRVMGEASSGLDLRAQPPAVILLAGLQGSGKTTTAAKLARRLIERERKRVFLASVDIYRPAAIDQLETLAGQVGAAFVPGAPGAKPAELARAAVAESRRRLADVLIIDTAGRLHVDSAMMQEVREVHAAAAPVETLFVIDSMAGQDAINAARAFGEALPLTGVVLTKADGDARGGAALSVRAVTGKPIKFLGVGEKTDALEAFHPERMASRILGMGDVLSLVEDVQQKVDREQADRLAGKLRTGKGFDFDDLKCQLEQMLAMGGLSALLDKLPAGMQLPQGAQRQPDDREVVRQIAIINSMTRGERRFPKTINGSRRRRIAAGSGTQVQDVNRLLKQFLGMQKLMKKASRGGMAQLMRTLGGGKRGHS
ncbi:MAG TPA: signal recognition particle protein [Gammaproteobacteria bacterium]|nr:signal recognition particle protein [Gammaproteobacteria bacterium]